jgi:hypothetical protein
MKYILGTAIAITAASLGATVQRHLDRSTIIQAQQNEAQAAGLEDVCKQTLQERTAQK